jgi:ATP-dependent protease HslVU (ClpYQ) peptidase subunit
MTAIVGVIDDGHVYLGGDSLALDGVVCWQRRSPKVYRRGEIVIGFSGAAVIMQHVLCILEWPVFHDTHEPLPWLVRHFLPALRSSLETHGQLGRATTEDCPGSDQMDANILIGMRGQLFDVTMSFGVTEVVEPYSAIGCGATPARAALHALTYAAPRAPIARLRIALETAAALVCSVRPPYHIVATCLDQTATVQSLADEH